MGSGMSIGCCEIQLYCVMPAAFFRQAPSMRQPYDGDDRWKFCACEGTTTTAPERQGCELSCAFFPYQKVTWMAISILFAGTQRSHRKASIHESQHVFILFRLLCIFKHKTKCILHAVQFVVQFAVCVRHDFSIVIAIVACSQLHQGRRRGVCVCVCVHQGVFVAIRFVV